MDTRRTYWTAFVATVTFFGGFYALLVPLPRYLADAGLPDWQVGFVLGAFGVASLLGRPVAGVASDRFGPRRVMLVGAASLMVGALGVVTTTQVGPLFLMRVLQATGYVAFTTAGTALIVSLVPPAERGRRLAVFGAAANVAIAVTPAAVSRLMEVAPPTAGLLVSAALAALGGLLAATLGAAGPVIPSEARNLDGGEMRDPLSATRRSRFLVAEPALERSEGLLGMTSIAPRRLWLPMLTAGLFGAGFAAFFQFAPILADRRGTIDSGSLYTLYGLGIIATRFVGGRLLDRLPVARVMVLAAGLVAIGYAAIAVSDVAAAMAAATLVVAVGNGLFHPALIAHHAALLPGAPGRATAAFYVGFDLGIGAGSWLFGAVLQFGGLAAMYWTAALLVAAVVPLTGLVGAAPREAAAPT